MRKFFVLLCLLFPAFSWAQDDVYFKAMQDELARTQKQLRIPNAPRPYFTAYWLTKTKGVIYESLWGELTVSSTDVSDDWLLMGRVHMVVGDKKENSHGFLHSHYYYIPNEVFKIGDGYDAVRLGLWGITDAEYREMVEIFAQKQAFMRQKNLADKSSDFAPAKQGSFLEPQPQWEALDYAYYEDLTKALSAEAKKYPNLEEASAGVRVLLSMLWYVNSQGGKMRLNTTWKNVFLQAQIRNKDGIKQRPMAQWMYTLEELPSKEELLQKANAFYKWVSEGYSAKKATPYIGPVLFKPAAAQEMINSLFVSNVSNTKPLLQEEGEDLSAGGFKDKIGQRVFAQQFTVEDKPLLREYKGVSLAGFAPIDAEGVPAENLLLVSNGKLLDLPFSRSLTQGRKKSNGHARVSYRQRPRAGITNLFVTPQDPLSQQELEQKLLDRCRELDLEYGYIVEMMPNAKQDLPNITRVYVKDGRKEQVYGAKLENFTSRSLRDILAAGDDETIFNFSEDSDPAHAIIVPSLLVDEVELVPTGKHPDRKPFVSKP